ncbi:MAG: ATP-binding protein [Turicibacter sp.]|nr:ATP-binding protein [Turicibacter sp.]
MITNYYWFIISIVMCFCDTVILYVVAHRVGGHKFNLSRKKLTLELIIGVIYGIVMGSIFYFNAGNATYRVLGYTILTTFVMFLTKRKIVEAVILFSFFFLVVSVIQIAFFFPFLLLLDLNQDILSFIVYLISMVVTISLCLAVKFHPIFLLFQQKLYLKIGAFLLFIVSNLILVIADFDRAHMLEQVIIISIFAFITFFGIIMTFVTAQEKIDQSSDKYHDVVNMFNGLYVSIKAGDDFHEIERQVDEIKKHLSGEETTAHNSGDDHVENLEALLYEKLAEKNKTNKLILDLGYFAPHKEVSFANLMVMLGILFDNALDHGKDKPIFVDLNVSSSILELTVKNSSEKKSEKAMQKIFKKGYSTKENLGHGKGLYNLEQLVREHHTEQFNATLSSECYYDEAYENYYFAITIDITDKNFL